VVFKSLGHTIFDGDESGHRNVLSIRLQPNEGIDLTVTIKEPGPGGHALVDVPLDMTFADALGEDGREVPDAYERLIMDVIRGNQTLFMRGDEVEAAWEWADPIIGGWEKRNDVPKLYDPGTSGPDDALMLLHRDGRRWRDIRGRRRRDPRGLGAAARPANVPRAARGQGNMELVAYADSEMMMIEVAQRLAGELRQALQSSDRASLAVPGGTTPGPIFDSLCAVDLDWDRVAVMLTDERWVPQESPRSNTRLLRQRLLVGKAAAAAYLPLHAPFETPEEGVPALAEAIAEVLPLTTCLLGMGEDMHTALCFPAPTTSPRR
jgi:hypothetical protein